MVVLLYQEELLSNRMEIKKSKFISKQYKLLFYYFKLIFHLQKKKIYWYILFIQKLKINALIINTDILKDADLSRI